MLTDLLCKSLRLLGERNGPESISCFFSSAQIDGGSADCNGSVCLRLHPPPPSPVPVSCISRSFRRSRLLCPLVGSFPSAAGVPVIYPLITGHGRFWESGHKCQTESKCSRFPSALFHRRSACFLFIPRSSASLQRYYLKRPDLQVAIPPMEAGRAKADISCEAKEPTPLLRGDESQ